MKEAPAAFELAEKIKEQLSKLLETTDWRLTNTTDKCEYSEKLTTGDYVLRLAGEPIASFRLYPMINCCGICVSTAASVIPSFRGKGLGTLLNSIRIDIARCDGYGLLLCTDIAQNEVQRKILKRNGWSDIKSFINPRTKNHIFISCINL